MSSGAVTRITDMASTAALFIMGGFIPSILASVKTPIEFTKKVTIEGKDVLQTVKLQSTFDAILPYMLPLLLTFGVYWLLKKKALDEPSGPASPGRRWNCAWSIQAPVARARHFVSDNAGIPGPAYGPGPEVWDDRNCCCNTW